MKNIVGWCSDEERRRRKEAETEVEDVLRKKAGPMVNSYWRNANPLASYALCFLN